MSNSGQGEATVSRQHALSVDPGNIRRQVLTLAGPALVEMMFATLIGMVDMMMVGRLGAAAVTAVGLTNQPLFFALGVFNALNVGTTAVVARCIGAKSPDEAAHGAKQSMALTAVLGLVVSCLGFLFARHVLAFMGGTQEVVTTGAVYVRVVAVGVVFMTMALNLTAILRGAGDMKTAMRVNLIANVVNVIGNYALIYGNLGMPRLGLAGAAVATSLARIVSFTLSAWVLWRGSGVIRVRLRGYKPDVEMLRRLLKVGFPAAMEEFTLRTGQLFFARIVAGFGTVVFAAHQISLNILGLSFMPGQAFAMSATTLVGQGLGAKEPTFSEKCAFETRKLGMFVSGFMALVFFFLGPFIMRLYTNDPEVISRGAMVLKIVALVQPAQTTQFVLRGALRGAGDTKWPFYATLIVIWGIRVFFAYVLGIILNLGLLGAWIALAVDQCVRAVVIAWRFRLGKWKTISV